MRAAICVERDGLLYRLVWLNESRKGIYYGILGSDRDHHQSYHSDGTRHWRAGRDRYHADVDVPVVANRAFRQLSTANASLSSDWLNPRTHYTPRVGELIIKLPEVEIVGRDSLLVDYYLVERPFEDEFRTGKWQAPSRSAMIFTVSLEHFPTHMIGIALEAANTRS